MKLKILIIKNSKNSNTDINNNSNNEKNSENSDIKENPISLTNFAKKKILYLLKQ